MKSRNESLIYRRKLNIPRFQLINSTKDIYPASCLLGRKELHYITRITNSKEQRNLTEQEFLRSVEHQKSEYTNN